MRLLGLYAGLRRPSSFLSFWIVTSRQVQFGSRRSVGVGMSQLCFCMLCFLGLGRCAAASRCLSGLNFGSTTSFWLIKRWLHDKEVLFCGLVLKMVASISMLLEFDLFCRGLDGHASVGVFYKTCSFRDSCWDALLCVSISHCV